MDGSLYRPLGLDLRHRARPGPRWPARLALGALLLSGAAGLTLATLSVQPDLRSVDALAPPPASTEPAAALAVAAAPAAPAGRAATDSAASVAEEAESDSRYATVTVSDPGSLRQPAALAHVPDDALVEASEFGPLPRRGEDGRRPLDVYAGAPGATLGTRVAIVVGGLGLSQTGTQAAIEDLPPGVTLAFAPTGNSLGRWMGEARRGRRELMIQAPMEPVGYPEVSPGPDTLTAEDALAGDFSALYAALGSMTNYVGVMNYMGAALSADDAALAALLAETDRRGLLYLDDGSSARSRIRDAGAETRAPFAITDVLLDRSNDAADVRRQLDLLERIARSQGSAIGVASAFDTSVGAIAAWAREARERGVEIVPVSQLAVDPERG